jgi:GTP-binding protein EngB required for normal cell division
MSSRRNSLCLSEDLPSRAPSTHNDDEVAVLDDDDDDDDQDDQEGGVHHRGGGGGEAPADRGVGADPGTASCSFMMESGSPPQLVMPSIKMPSRRPFTEDGKRMGRLKVLIAGDSGVGKTTLIKAIVQSCEHIVHVDPIHPSTGPSTPGARAHSLRRRSSTKTTTGTTAITEIYASTKPYPEWWSEVDDFRVLRRRKSLGDAVLDRNLCFVDTPGYGSGSSVSRVANAVCVSS